MERPPKVYKSRRPWIIALRVFVSALAVLLLAAVIAFFAFQKYIVYTDDGLTLEIPFLQQYESGR